MAEPVQGVAALRFAMFFQIGMFVIGGVLIGIGVSAGVAMPVVLGVAFMGAAIAGFYWTRRSLRQLRGR